MPHLQPASREALTTAVADTVVITADADAPCPGTKPSSDGRTAVTEFLSRILRGLDGWTLVVFNPYYAPDHPGNRDGGL